MLGQYLLVPDGENESVFSAIAKGIQASFKNLSVTVASFAVTICICFGGGPGLPAVALYDLSSRITGCCCHVHDSGCNYIYNYLLRLYMLFQSYRSLYFYG